MYEFHTDIIPDRPRFVNAFHKTTKRKKFSTVAFLRKIFTATRFYGKNKSGGKFFRPPLFNQPFCILYDGELTVIKSRIKTAFLHKFVVSAFFYYVALVHYEYKVGVFNRR